jgi:putative oxidoreductase
MERWLGRYGDVAYALLRIIAGVMFALHGAQKLFGFLGPAATSDTRMLIAGIVEFVGGLMIAVGFEAGWAAFVAAGEMAVAYFTVHAPGSFWPTVNKGELALLYCFVFLFVATRGSGPYSLDQAVRRGGRARR